MESTKITFDLDKMMLPPRSSVGIATKNIVLALSSVDPLTELLLVLCDPQNCIDVPRGKYHEYMRSDRWKRKSQAMRAYFKTCAVCNSTKKLCVHHKHYETVGHERLGDLTVLCGDHHWEYEEKRIKAKEASNVV